jgi:hypothetical protein
MNQEVEITPIPKIPQDLLKKMLKEEIIVFIGSGVSMLANVPSWKDLALSYLEDWRSGGELPYDVYDKLKREKTDPLELLTICSGVLGVDVMKKQLEGKLTGKEDIDRRRRLYGYIRDLRTGYVTTNYDDFLETTLPSERDELASKESEYLEKLQKPLVVTLNRVDLDDKLDVPIDKIVYLHGKASSQREKGIENKIILTLKDYLEHYRDTEKGKNGKSFLKQVFNKTFLFIGLGLKEFEIIQHIQKPSNNTNHYLLLGVSNHEKCILEQYINYYKILNIEPVFYSISDNGYHQLEYVLKAWSDSVRGERIKNYENRITAKKDNDNLIKIQRLKDGSFK